MAALLGRLTDRRMNELIDLLDPKTDKPGKPEHYLKMIFRGFADIGHRKARWKDDQETALEKVEAHSRALRSALNSLAPPYRTSETIEMTLRLDKLALDSFEELKTGSRLNTQPWADTQILALLVFYIDWSQSKPESMPDGKCYNFLYECMKTIMGEHPRDYGRGGLRGAYKRLLPKAIYSVEHRFDFLRG
ncbi:MAG: hypothetical protein DHS20C04_30610 [Hyphococcus sp.]|nr:MAG: hypothetical protein DHS20C04_30610 [Marinicaulis sp.]